MFLAVNPAVWWSWYHPPSLLCSPPLHQWEQRSQEARRTVQPLTKARVPASSSASLQKPELYSALLSVFTSHLAAAVMVLWKTLLAWMTLC